MPASFKGCRKVWKEAQSFADQAEIENVSQHRHAVLTFESSVPQKLSCLQVGVILSVVRPRVDIT